MRNETEDSEAEIRKGFGEIGHRAKQRFAMSPKVTYPVEYTRWRRKTEEWLQGASWKRRALKRDEERNGRKKGHRSQGTRGSRTEGGENPNPQGSNLRTSKLTLGNRLLPRGCRGRSGWRGSSPGLSAHV